MFSLFQTLGQRKKVVDLSGYVRRICDLTIPNRPFDGDQGRVDDRYNRTLPVLIAPWSHDRPHHEQCLFATTRDLSDGGTSVVTAESLSGDVVVGFWLPNDDWTEPWFFLGDVARSTALGGGFWVTGIGFTEFANTEHRPILGPMMRLAEQLSPEWNGSTPGP